MVRIYAGILGTLAMAIVICRGWLDSAGVEGTLTAATLSLAAYAILGAILGQLAQNTVDDSVRARIQQQLTHRTAHDGTREAIA